MPWELKRVMDVEATMDDSGVYVVINRHLEKQGREASAPWIVHVRADLMTGQTPIMSFIGSANAVRKHLIAFLTGRTDGRAWNISKEHASYIGYELLRAETDPNYVQD